MLHRALVSPLLVLVLTIGMASSGLAQPVPPQRTFVASYGLDTHPCTLALPCRGFQAAIDAVAPGGEVVAIDSAGYGAMEIYKSVSVIVPPGVHAGLSPATGIPLPGYPGQYGVVLIDIQDTDVVVLRGLNVNRQGAVTGGIEWISTHGGKVHLENVVVNGFPNEGVYMQAPSGSLFIKDSEFRGNAIGIYGGVAGHGEFYLYGIHADRIRIEDSSVAGIRLLLGLVANLSNSQLARNEVAVDVRTTGSTYSTYLILDHCNLYGNTRMWNLEGGTSFATAGLISTGSTLLRNGTRGDAAGQYEISSYGNNATLNNNYFTATYPPM